ncbi:MAG: sigma-70 family RNA polymerase sigma factor [Phycisphaerales bacterium]|nr:sigma-70 family RNA polymerase sigma factor [Phycisphaerales bacterium]MCI0676152.1 sigma-70 family RNA polymerase sigma factor [Phycisphaerales bacterium]
MERAEFEKLAVAELDGLYRFARFLTRDVAKAEDLVQDVYARAFRPESIEAFNPVGGGMRAWLMTIARTTFYGRLEHDGADSRAMDRLGQRMADRAGELECPDPSRVNGVDWGMTGPAVSIALDSLNGDLRDVLWLWAVEGLKYREIAEALEVPIGTVMSRLHRARSQVSQALLADGPLHAELIDAGIVETRPLVSLPAATARPSGGGERA